MTAMHFVTLAGEVCAIAVYEKPEGGWVARGEHRGVAIRAEARSQEAALVRWQEAWQEAAVAKSGPTRKPKQPASTTGRDRESKAGTRSPSRKGVRARKKPAQRK